MDFPKIMSDQYPHNMGPWLSEKSQSGLRALVEMRKSLIQYKANRDEKLLDYLESDLYYALSQMTTIFCFSNGKDDSVANIKLIFDDPDDGFEQLLVKNGLLEKTTKQINEENKKRMEDKYKDFIQKINAYLELDQYLGRSLLQELFVNNYSLMDKNTPTGRFLLKIEDDLFKFANSEIDWKTFVFEAKEKMDFVNDSLSHHLF